MDFCLMLFYKYFFFFRLHFKKKKKKIQDLHGRQKFENYI